MEKDKGLHKKCQILMWQLLREKWDPQSFILEMRETKYCHVFFPKMERVLALHRRDLGEALYDKATRYGTLTTSEVHRANWAVWRHRSFTQETIKSELGVVQRAILWLKEVF